MRIECLTTFLNGRERYEKGDTFTIDDARGAYFVEQQWAKKVGDQTPAPLPGGETDLTIQNSTIGLGDNHG